MLKIIRADSPDRSRYYVFSDNEPDKPTKVVELVKKLPENAFARAYHVSDGDISDPAKVAEYCLKKENAGIPLREVLSVMDYVEAKFALTDFLSGIIRKKQYLVFRHSWTEKYLELVAEPGKEALERFVSSYAIPSEFFKALDGLPIVMEQTYDATYVRIRERYDMPFRDMLSLWGKTHSAFAIPKDPFVPYEIDQLLRDRLIKGSETSFWPKEIFGMLNSQKIRKSSVIHHFFNRFGLERNAKSQYVKMAPISWKKHIYRKKAPDYAYEGVDRKLETLHRFHNLMFHGLPLLVFTRLHFSGNLGKAKAQLAKYARYVRSEYLRKVGLTKLADEALERNIEGILSKTEELVHAADHLKANFQMGPENVSKYLGSPEFSRKVGMNVSSGWDPGDELRSRATAFIIKTGLLKSAKAFAATLAD